MSKAPRSGRRVTAADLPIIFGMLKRGDRKHDITAWLGLNPGRCADVEKGKFGAAAAAPEAKLPPSGSPGPRATELRQAVNKIHQLLKAGDVAAAMKRIDEAQVEFDKNI